MQDGIIKGVGNSRFLKSVPSFLSLYPTYEAFAAALVAGTLPIDLNGINEAGWSQLGTPLNKAHLLSDATAAALGLKTYTVEKALGDYAVGETAYLKEDGVMTPFTVLQHDYQSDLNGPGRTLLIRQGAAGASVWNESGVNTYADSTADVYLNETYQSRLDEAIQTAMGTTSFPSGDGNGATTVSTLSRAVFLLSLKELTGSTSSAIPAEGEKISVFTGSAALAEMHGDGWTRTPYGSNAKTAFSITATGGYSTAVVTAEKNLYPCFTLPADYQMVYYYNDNGEVQDKFFDRANPEGVAAMLGPLAMQVPRKGNCSIEMLSYTGTGTESFSITFPRRPYFIIITGAPDLLLGDPSPGNQLNIIARANTANGASFFQSAVLSWNINKMTITVSSYLYGNRANTLYHVFAFYREDTE